MSRRHYGTTIEKGGNLGLDLENSIHHSFCSVQDTEMPSTILKSASRGQCADLNHQWLDAIEVCGFDKTVKKVWLSEQIMVKFLIFGHIRKIYDFYSQIHEQILPQLTF